MGPHPNLLYFAAALFGVLLAYLDLRVGDWQLRREIVRIVRWYDDSSDGATLQQILDALRQNPTKGFKDVSQRAVERQLLELYRRSVVVEFSTATDNVWKMRRLSARAIAVA